MSWILNATGHTNDADAEARLLDALAECLAAGDAGTYTATVRTQHHGQVELVVAGRRAVTTADETDG